MFAGNPLDRAEHLRGHDDEIAALMKSPDAHFLCLWRLRPLFESEDNIRLVWLTAEEVEPLLRNGAPWVLLGLGIEGKAHFGLDVTQAVKEGDKAPPFADRGVFLEVLQLTPRLDPVDAAILGHAKALLDWHARHRFCAVCGTETEMRQAGTSRFCPDPECKAQHFPRTDPVAIMLPILGDKCLLGRQPFFPKAMYSALAGFIEPGESIEEGVRREVEEEAGIKVGAVRYHSSQPWPFPSSLMIGCHCEAISEDIDVSGDELENAEWFSRQFVREALEGGHKDELWMPPPFAIAHQLILAWVNSED